MSELTTFGLRHGVQATHQDIDGLLQIRCDQTQQRESRTNQVHKVCTVLWFYPHLIMPTNGTRNTKAGPILDRVFEVPHALLHSILNVHGGSLIEPGITPLG